MSSQPRLLNFGCGAVHHPEWINVDTMPVGPGVIPHDVRRGMPFADESFDAVYASHVLEHLQPAAAATVLRECYRVLRPDGVARIVVPDLEAIARLYLQSLEGALSDDAEAKQRYDWAMLELYDQAVRTVSGGAMGAYLRRPLDPRQAAFVASRIGDEARSHAPATWRPRIRARVTRAALALRRLGAMAATFLFLGKGGHEALREGLFRRAGEVHQWMYDRFSMRRAMEDAGFTAIRICKAADSAIPGFARYGLETRDGRPRKPDSLYVEGTKPGARRE